MGSSGDSVTYDKDNFLATYQKLPKKPQTTIRLFERGEKYSVYGEDAKFVTQELSHTSTGIRRLNNPDLRLTVDYYNLPKSNSDTFIRDLLLVKQKRVEVWINKGKTWVAEYKGSPGNLTQFEDLIFSNVGVAVNNGIVGIRLGGTAEKNKMVGIAYVNTNECVINLIEFLDNEMFSNFESVLVQLSPKEAVVPIAAGSPSSEDLNNIQKILERNGIMINPKKASDFDAKDIVQDLTRLVKMKTGELQNVAANPELDKQLAVSALSCSIKYLDLLSNEIYFNQFRIEPFDFSLYVKMDSSAAQALHLVPSSHDIGQRNVTLLSFLDNCKTAQGHRLLAQFLRQPIVDKDKLEERLDLVEIFMNDISLRHTLTEEHLRRVPDFQALARKFSKKKATLQDCYKSYLCLTKMGKLVEDLEMHESNHKHALTSVFIDPIKTLADEFKNFVEMVKATLDLELADKGEFMISPNFDETLLALRNEMDSTKKKMDNELTNVATAVKLDEKSIKLETNNMFGYYFRVTLKEEKAIRNKRDYSILDSNKAGVRFRNSNLEILNEKYQKKLSVYLENQKQFTEDILEVASGYHNSFEQLGNVMAHLDVISNFASVASNAPAYYTRPKLHPSGSGIISFTQLRHPLVESHAGVNYIPNDIKFEKGKQSFYILTGPNMGGKSTFLRSVGIATLLAQIGCFVPAEDAEIAIVDAILARVGAQDSLIKGVSTFMSEMIETSFILKTATSSSLVLIDELGRGTSTFDGFGLCYAISRHLAAEVDCFCVLATHFHELTDLSDEVPSVANIHVTALANNSGLALLYKVEKGSCDRSFGLHVAEVTDFPPDVLKSAKSMAAKLEDYCSEKDLDDSEAGVKRRKLEKQEGQKIIDKFLEDIKELKRTTSEEEYQVEAKKLLNSIKTINNPYITHLLQLSS